LLAVRENQLDFWQNFADRHCNKNILAGCLAFQYFFRYSEEKQG
jgi:hypothetical protein